MSSEAITRNDLTAILNEVLPPTPSEYKKLLWTNPSPTSSFAAQTISLDLSDYDAIEIIIRSDTANTYTLAPIVTEVGKGGIAFNSTAYNSGRQFTTTTSGITFTGATYYSSYGNWSTTSTNALIPVYIYGIKYERVAPPLADIEVVPIVSGNTGTTLYRIGNIRALYFNGTSGSGISGITISSIDLPAVDIRGVGVRRDSSASGTQVGMVVLRASSGKIDAYKCSTYGSTISAIGSTDTMVGMLLWSV